MANKKTTCQVGLVTHCMVILVSACHVILHIRFGNAIGHLGGGMLGKCWPMHLHHAMGVAPLLCGSVCGVIATCFLLVVNGRVWHLTNPKHKIHSLHNGDLAD